MKSNPRLFGHILLRFDVELKPPASKIPSEAFQVSPRYSKAFQDIS